MPKKTVANTYTYAIGRRKSAVAAVKLYSGKGDSAVNGKDIKKYFQHLTDQIFHQRPFFIATNTVDKYHFSAKIVGGGINGQLEALALAISRALKKIDLNLLPVLRSAGLLTVDSRVRQRRMIGTGGKARRQKQSPKR